MSSNPKVFLSYAHEDRQAVEEIYRFLEDNGCDPWMDVKNLLPGQDWEYEIENAIESTDFFVACLSTHSVNRRGYVQKELKKAVELLQYVPEGDIFLIPARLDNCSLPRSLSRIQWLDWFEFEARPKLLTVCNCNTSRATLPVEQHLPVLHSDRVLPQALLEPRIFGISLVAFQKSLVVLTFILFAGLLLQISPSLAGLLGIDQVQTSTYAPVATATPDESMPHTPTPSSESILTATATALMPTARPTLQPANIADLEQVSIMDDELCRGVESLAFSPDGRLLAGGGRLRICLWDATTGQTVQTFDEINATARSLAFSPDGRLFASGGDEGVLLWDTETGNRLSALSDQSVNSLAFSPDGTMLATGGADVALWNVQTGELLHVLAAPEDGNCTSLSTDVLSVAFNPDGTLLAVSTDLGALQMLDVLSWAVLYEGPVARGCDTRLAFDPTGKWLASGTHASTIGEDVIQLWALEAGGNLREVHRMSPLNAWGYYLVFSPNGTILVSGTEDFDGGIQFWAVETGTELRMINELDWINGVAFSSHGFLAVGSNTGVYLFAVQ